MKAKLFSRNLLSLLLAFSMILALAIPIFSVVAVADTDQTTATQTGKIEPDLSWYLGHENDTVFEISTAAQLLGLMEMHKDYYLSDGTEKVQYKEDRAKLAGKTIELTADIDLNPGWDATTTVNGANGTGPSSSYTITLPESAPNKWYPMGGFQCIFDGNGHTIKGLYIDYDVVRSKTGLTDSNGNDLYPYTGLGFTATNKGTIKNVVFTNGLVIAHFEQGDTRNNITGAPTNIRVGTVAGNNNGTIENVYSDIDVWAASSKALFINVGGIVGRCGVEGFNLNNCVFTGKAGTLNAPHSTTGPYSPATVYIDSIVGSLSEVKGKVENCLDLGRLYYASGNTKKAFGAQDSKATKTNNLSGKKDASFLTSESGTAYAADWVYNDNLGCLIPKGVSDNLQLPFETKDIMDYTGSEAAGSVFTVSNAAGLVYAAELSRKGETFAGKTLKLLADIDLNPGWNAHVNVAAGKGTLPELPGVVFPGFQTFDGTLNGNGKTISGIFMASNLNSSTPNLAPIEFLRGTVKNLKINNSLIVARPADGVEACKISGLVARVTGNNALIDTVYLDVEVWSRSYSKQQIGGVAGITNANNITIRNTEFAGVVGTMVPDDSNMSATVPSTSTSVNISQLVGDGDWKTTLKIDNCAMRGTAYAASGVTTTNAVASNDKATKTIITTRPDAVAAMNPTAYTGTVAAFGTWPTGTVDSKNSSYDADTRTQVKFYENVTEANATAYYTALVNAGYTLVKSYELGGNIYKLFEKEGAYTVYTGWYANNGGSSNHRMSIYTEPFGRSYNTASEAVSGTNVCTAQLWQLDVYNQPDSNNWGGMGYIIRLTDGTFVIVDGGYSDPKESANIYSILTQNNVLSGKPVITAWFITHAHLDHYGALNKFAQEHANDVTVKGFYYNLPGNDILVGTDVSKEATGYQITEAMTQFDGAKLYGKMHTGMTVGFSGATATVLYTHEEGTMTYYKNGAFVWSGTANKFEDANDSSMVIKFTIGTQTFTVLGDVGDNPANWMTASHADATLKADLMQVSHHGYSYHAELKSLYQKIDPSVALWPMDVAYLHSTNGNKELFKQYYNNTDGITREANTWLKNNCDEVIPAYENACLTLPYTAKTYSGGRKLPDIDTAYQIKLGQNAGGAYFQMKKNDDNTYSLRVVGVITQTAEQLANAESVSFDLILNRGGQTVEGSVTAQTVYQSVVAAGATVTAEKLNGTYLFVYVINGISAEDVITISARTNVTTDTSTSTSLYTTVEIQNGTISE